jgi:PrtD family type I secretion system ABC transporter
MRRKRADYAGTPLERALSETRRIAGPLLVFGAGINLLLLTSPIFMMQVFDRVLTSGRPETLVFLTLIAIVALGVLGALDMVRMKMLSRVGIWLEKQLAPDVLQMCLRARLMGNEVTSQALRDLAALRAFIGGAGVLALCDAPWAPLFLLVLLSMHLELGALAIVSAAVLFALAVLNEYLSRAPLRDEARSQITDRETAEQALKNAEALKAMGMLPGFLARWAERNTETLAAQLDAGERGAVVMGLSKFVRLAVQVLILALGAALVLKGELTSGGMIAASIILGRALAPVEQSIGAWKSFVAARYAYARLKELFTKTRSTRQPMRLPPPMGRIAVEQVVFLPPRAPEPVIKGVDFTLEPGEALGVIGPSAAGKSTLCRLLVGVWEPTRGHVRLDGADLRNWEPGDLGQHVGYLPQDVELFAGTIKDNIARLGTNPDPAGVVEAAKLAGVHEMILGLPQGYDTEIGLDGALLSGGQRQRIGLARALYGRPRLIVLDEPNANLDSEGEEALQDALITAKNWGATLIVVAHQPGILRPVDKVLLLLSGQMRYFGPRDQLMGQLRTVQARPEQRARPALAPAREARS